MCTKFSHQRKAAVSMQLIAVSSQLINTITDAHLFNLIIRAVNLHLPAYAALP